MKKEDTGLWFITKNLQIRVDAGDSIFTIVFWDQREKKQEQMASLILVNSSSDREASVDVLCNIVIEYMMWDIEKKGNWC